MVASDAVVDACVHPSSALCASNATRWLLVDSSDPSSLPPWAGILLDGWRPLANEWHSLPRPLFFPYCHHSACGANADWKIFPLVVMTVPVHPCLEAAPAASALVAAVSAAVGPALLNAAFSMSAGAGHIAPHCDGREGQTLMRYLLALDVPEPAAEFRICGSPPRTFREGDLFAFNNSQPHEVINHADQPRIVLLLDVMHGHLADDAAKREATLESLRGIWSNSLQRVAQLNAAASLEVVLEQLEAA